MSAHRRHKIKTPPRPPTRRRGERAPDSICEPQPEKGPRQEKTGSKLPAVWEPRFLDRADSRFSAVRLVRQRIELLEADAGADSEQKRLLCSRAAFIATVLETEECRCLENGQPPTGSYFQMTNCLIGLLRAIGLERHARDAGDLRSYLAEKSA